MKTGRYLYTNLSAAAREDQRLRILRGLKGPELAAVIHYAEGCEDCESRHEILGMALLEAAGRYVAKVKRKQKRKVRKVL